MLETFLEHYVIYSLLAFAILVDQTFVYFSAIMRWQEVRANGNLQFSKNPVLWCFCYKNLLVGGLMDATLNVFMSIPFLELPQWQNKEILLTARLCRHYEQDPASWRGRLATWFGVTLLNPIDPSGKHVK
jgi:hypothetical protein